MSTNFVNNTFNKFLPVAQNQCNVQTANAASSDTPNTKHKLENNTLEPLAAVTIDKEKKKSHAPLAVTATALALASGTFALVMLKGPSSAFYKRISSYMQKIDDKIYDYTSRHQSLTTLQKWYLVMNQGLHKALSSLKMCNNITAAKDSGFKWICKKLHLTKPMDWITAQFKKITVSSSTKAYERARNISDRNIAKLREYVAILSKKDAKAATQLQELIAQLEKELDTFTNATERAARLKQIEAATKNIGKKVDIDLHEILTNPTKENLAKLKIYRTEINASKGKDALNADLQQAQRTCTFNIDDKTKIMKEAREEINAALNPGDQQTRKAMRDLSKQIAKYKELAGKAEAQERETLVAKMRETIAQAKQAISSQNYSQESIEIFEANIKKIEGILNKTDEKGTIENILQLLNSHFKVSSPNEYNAAKVLTNEIRSVINEACEKELKLYDKFAEYSVGSAPTDVLGLMLPIGLASYTISKGEDKDERISATLKAGVPITGAVATTFWATAKMLTNMQGLFLGLLAGMGLNAIGSKADENYKAYTQDKQFAKKAIAAYKASLSKSDSEPNA